MSLFDLATAQELLLGGAGELDTVLVDADPGVTEDELTDRIAAALPDGQEALTGSAIVEEQQDIMAQAMGFFGTFLLVFAIIGLVVACFTIFNTFQIVITQRIREMALLRAIGATRWQVLGAQLVEALVVGLTASVVGLVLGVAVAALLQAMLVAFGIDMPSGGTVFLPRTAIIALIVGTLVTVGSAVFPALRASRIPPIAALRDVGARPNRPGAEPLGPRWCADSAGRRGLRPRAHRLGHHLGRARRARRVPGSVRARTVGGTTRGRLHQRTAAAADGHHRPARA